MGQNSNRQQFNQSQNENYFLKQLQCFRWRANTQINTHICRVSFLLESSITNRQSFKQLIDEQYQNFFHISIKEILKLAQTTNKSEGQLMEFQKYRCSLEQMSEKLTLQDVLYVLSILFSGYEILWSKFGKIPIKLQNCFVTNEGEVRVWINSDFKSNEVLEEDNKRQQMISQVHLIKRIIQMGQRLSIKHTEYLLFSRQFKQFMERDIFRHYNFATCRKYINSYTYTYKINQASNLSETIKRLVKEQITERQETQIYIESSRVKNISKLQTKHPFRSTGGSDFAKSNKSINSSLKQASYRLVSYSGSQRDKNSQSNLSYGNTSIKHHEKKFSSTDLKDMQFSSRKLQSPKMNKSQILKNKKLVDFKFNIDHGLHYLTQERSIQSIKSKQSMSINQHKENSERNPMNKIQFQRKQGKAITFNSGNPDNQFQEISNSSNNGILKQSQLKKSKKNLQKKVASISNYVSFFTSDEHVQKQTSIQNIMKLNHINKQDYICQKPIEKFSYQYLVQNQKGNKRLQHKTSIQPNYLFENNKSRAQNIKSQGQNDRNQNNSFSRDDNHHNMCFTRLTINNLLENSNCSMQESNGSFMSIQNSNDSEYNGVLCGMGRSIDIQNISSNKKVQDYPLTKLNKSIN